MNYLLVDESDPADYFECEGAVLKTFFASSKMFNTKQSLELIRKNKDIELSLKRNKHNHFNIVQFSAHGFYNTGAKTDLDYSGFVKRRGNKRDIEIFRPDSIVRTGLHADIFLSTNCETFNPLFIDVLKHYKGVSNYIAPVNSPYIGNTLIFSMMFYSPEQYAGDKDKISYRTDFFSLGALAYYLFYQKLPFGNSEEEVSQKFKSKNEAFDIDDGFKLKNFCSETMKFSPAERPRLINDIINLL